MNFIETVKAAGIVGAGGAGFPTHVKLNSKAEYLIINAAECEPLIETDKFICRNFADEVVDAVLKTGAHLGATKLVIALKGKYVPEIAALKTAINKAGANIEISEMPTYYPAGDEQSMVQFVTGRSVPERGLPLDVNCVVDNVGTMLNVHNALNGTPVCEKFLSVTGDVKNTIMLNVPIGTSLVKCIEQAGPLYDDYIIIEGGPMMGKVVTDKEKISQAVVTKTTGNVIVLPKDHYLVKRATLPIETIRHQTRSSCIQCRMCTDLCPRYMIGHQMRPHLVMRNMWRENQITDDQEFLRSFGDAQNCCDCGACEMFACPMGLSPRKVNAYFKTKLRERGLSQERLMTPEARQGINERRIPTERLVARLGLSEYYHNHAQDCLTLSPESVFVPLRQHIGKPATAIVKAGDTVQKGQLVAEAQEGISANIHTGFAGVVKEVTADGILICSGGGR
ncbi:MAG: 4Fe-4S dicluster domain-containing protein [Synergistaceae bacterium]